MSPGGQGRHPMPATSKPAGAFQYEDSNAIQADQMTEWTEDCANLQMVTSLAQGEVIRVNLQPSQTMGPQEPREQGAPRVLGGDQNEQAHPKS